jgi:hypothetical protein
LFYHLPAAEKGEEKPFPPTIKIQPYGFITEAILVSTLSSSEKMVNIIKDVATLPPGFDPYDLFIADQHMILAIARSLTYGEKYNFSSSCPTCGFEEKHSLKVPDEIPCRIWTDKEVEKDNTAYVNINRFTIRLPECKDTLELKFPIIKDNDRVNKYGEEKKKLVAGYDPSHTRRLSLHIKSVNGEQVDDIDQLEREFVMKLRGPDMVYLKDQIDALSCGIIQNWDIKCGKCSASYRAYIPLLTSFFRRD